MEKMKPCEKCGQMMPYQKSCKRYCAKCARDIKNERAGEYKRMKRLVGKNSTSKDPDRTLTRIAIEAREHGMSYGRYVASMTGGRK